MLLTVHRTSIGKKNENSYQALLSRLFFRTGVVGVPDAASFLSAPGAALPENELVRLFNSRTGKIVGHKRSTRHQLFLFKKKKYKTKQKYQPEIKSIILRRAPHAVMPISHRSLSASEVNVAMSTS